MRKLPASTRVRAPLLETLKAPRSRGRPEERCRPVAAHVRLVEDGAEHRNQSDRGPVVFHVKIQEGPVTVGQAAGVSAFTPWSTTSWKFPRIVRPVTAETLMEICSRCPRKRHEARDSARRWMLLLTQNRFAKECSTFRRFPPYAGERAPGRSLVRCIDDEVTTISRNTRDAGRQRCALERDAADPNPIATASAGGSEALLVASRQALP